VITRHDLDAIVNERAVKAGATVWQGTEARADPRRAGGSGTTGGLRLQLRGVGDPVASCMGAVVKEKATGATRKVRARYVVVADGANSRFGRALGTSATATSPWAWPCAATTPHPVTTDRSSSPTSTSATATARWSRVRMDLPPRGRAGQRRGGPPLDRQAVEGRQHLDPDGPLRGRTPLTSGSSPPADLPRPTHRGQAAHGPGRRTPGRAPPRWWWATPPVRSTRSTGRGSPTATRRAAWPQRRWARRSCGDGAEALGALRDAARGRLRALLPGGPGLHPGDQPIPSSCSCAWGRACTRSR
jgi:2-polyprenyl-6-methoxyphenol hydroxylase-like FAD-dependent oxidoreductase